MQALVGNRRITRTAECSQIQNPVGPFLVVAETAVVEVRREF